MAYLKYEDAEALFLNEIRVIGVADILVMVEGKYDFYRITQKNGDIRYWKCNQSRTKAFNEALEKIKEEV